MTSLPQKPRRTAGALTAVGLATALTTLTTLTACSDGADGADTSGSASRADGTVETEGTFPQTVTTKFGDVTVEEQPTRVVALGWGDAETALELGVQPVGASDWLDFGGDGVGPWLDDAYDSSPEIIGTQEPDFEAIAALEPDLILDVRSSGDKERHDELEKIATTVGVPEGADSYLTPREEQVELISTALGLPEDGKRINREYDDTVESIRQDHPQWAEKTAATVARSTGGWGAYIAGSERYDTLLDLGFRENETLAKEKVGDTGFSVPLSDETLSKADSDLVIAFAVGTSAEDVETNGSWKTLQATRDGRSFVMPEEISSAYALGSPAAIEFALDKLVPVLDEHTDR